MHQMLIEHTPDQSDVVSFRIGDQDYCIDIDVVREIRGWSPTTVLPHSPPHITGVINLRGTVVAVVDLAARLGLPQTVPTPRHVVIIVSVNSQTVGLLADVVSDILGIDEGSVKPVPDVGPDPTRAFITNLITHDDGRILRKLDMDKILPRSAGGQPS
jgi:purine-binding chemotaxis protein CheW